MNIYKLKDNNLILEIENNIIELDDTIFQIYGELVYDIYSKYYNNDIKINFIYIDCDMNTIYLRTFDSILGKEIISLGNNILSSLDFYIEFYESDCDYLKKKIILKDKNELVVNYLENIYYIEEKIKKIKL